MIMINNPHNPCGSILSKDEMESLRIILSDYQGIIVWDEVYDYLVFDDLQHQSALLYEDLMTKSVVVYSMGKHFTTLDGKWAIPFQMLILQKKLKITSVHGVLCEYTCTTSHCRVYVG